jgi:hypothetical protein
LKITTPEAYRKAIDRVDELRSAGKTAENDAELAELEGAVAAYEALPDEPDESKGKPTPNPHGRE